MFYFLCVWVVESNSVKIAYQLCLVYSPLTRPPPSATSLSLLTTMDSIPQSRIRVLVEMIPAIQFPWLNEFIIIYFIVMSFEWRRFSSVHSKHGESRFFFCWPFVFQKCRLEDSLRCFISIFRTQNSLHLHTHMEYNICVCVWILLPMEAIKDTTHANGNK